jgi:expansin (peptidoglycan-binding protein)
MVISRFAQAPCAKEAPIAVHLDKQPAGASRGSIAFVIALAAMAACGNSSHPSDLADAAGAETGSEGGMGATMPRQAMHVGSIGGIAFGAPVTGVATYYAADGSGNCSFDATPDDLDVAAINHTQYADSAACGACAKVVGASGGGTVTVRIVDQCPECAPGDLDLSMSAFAKIDDVAKGRVPITFTYVPCTVTGNVTYRYKDGSSQFWTAIQVQNTKVPVLALAIKKGGTFVDVHRESYDYFVDPQGAGEGDVVVRITSFDGQVLEDTLPPAASNVTAVGNGQFE